MLSARPTDRVVQQFKRNAVAGFQLPVIALNIALVKEHIADRRGDDPAALAADGTLDSSGHGLTGVCRFRRCGVLVSGHESVRRTMAQGYMSVHQDGARRACVTLTFLWKLSLRFTCTRPTSRVCFCPRPSCVSVKPERSRSGLGFLNRPSGPRSA